jgi:hypothetical protein
LKNIAQAVYSEFKTNIASPLAHASGYIQKIHIDIEYKQFNHTLEISTKTWPELITAIQSKFPFNAAIKSIFRIKNGHEFAVTDMSGFINKETYYIRTEIDEPGIN